MKPRKNAKKVETESNQESEAPVEKSKPAAAPKGERIFILKYNRPNIFRFSNINAAPAKDGNPAHSGDRDLVLYPKNNFVKESDWELVKNHPMIEALFADQRFDGNLSPIMEWKQGYGPDDSLESEGDEIKTFLEGMTDKEAKKIIFDTLDKPTLEGWLDVEQRPAVRTFLLEQLDVLKLPEQKTA